MIVRMTRVRVAGPRSRLDETLRVLQDAGVLHVDRPEIGAGRGPDRLVARQRRHAERSVLDVETALARLSWPTTVAAPSEPPAWPAAARRARRVRRLADALVAKQTALEDERSLLVRYREFFQVFESLAHRDLTWPDGQAFYVVLRPDGGGLVAELTRRLDEALDGQIEVLHRALSTGEWAVLILASAQAAPRVSGLLAASRVEELPAPEGIAETDLLRALPAIKARLAQIPRALAAVDAERQALARREGPWLAGIRACLRDELLRLDARAKVFAADYLFVIEGWLPQTQVARLTRQLAASLGADVDVSLIGTRGWETEAAPVALHNPPLFEPFEVLTRMVPLPKYGTIDPTPFVAIFFPAFFGLILGDVGYGLMLAVLAAILRLKSTPATTLRSISTVAFACSSAAVAFGVLFGEFFGSLGHTIGLRPVFDRESATIPFLLLAVALGAVHILLGLVLAGVSAWRRGHRREAVGRGVALGMLVLTGLSLLASVSVLPRGLFTPLAIAVLAAFAILVALEGVVAIVEIVSTAGHLLSYARIMALGTASLMLAVVANEMAGALGSVLVGVVFALVFHLVNFAIGLFSPTIHALRLHYVEFFGEFFRPGGAEYRPFGHWHPSP